MRDKGWFLLFLPFGRPLVRFKIRGAGQGGEQGEPQRAACRLLGVGAGQWTGNGDVLVQYIAIVCMARLHTINEGIK